MAQIGHGYGSEFQLLRFLGHHRNLLECEICKQASLSGTFHWLDFDFASNTASISGDAENKGLSFLKKIDFVTNESYNRVIEEYKSYSIGNSANWQNWDAIFYLDKTIYLVEAKAHVKEISGNKQNGGESVEKIMDFMKNQLPDFSVSEVWMKEYYQFANRLATTALLNNCGIKAKTLYIYFVNGYDRRFLDGRSIQSIENKDASVDDFKHAIEIEMKTLGISHDQIENYMTKPVFIDANPLKIK